MNCSSVLLCGHSNNIACKYIANWFVKITAINNIMLKASQYYFNWLGYFQSVLFTCKKTDTWISIEIKFLSEYLGHTIQLIQIRNIYKSFIYTIDRNLILYGRTQLLTAFHFLSNTIQSTSIQKLIENSFITKLWSLKPNHFHFFSVAYFYI